MSSKRKNPPQSSRQRKLVVTPPPATSNKRNRLVIVDDDEEDDQLFVAPSTSSNNSLKRTLPDEDDGDDSRDNLHLFSQKPLEEANVLKFTPINLRDFEPKTSKELVVSSQKLNELKSWFRQHFGADDEEEANSAVPSTSTAPATTSITTSNTSPFLLLNGPSGTGKTASLKVLCREFSVTLVELPTTSLFKEDDLLTKDIANLEISRSAHYKGRLEKFADDDEEIKGVNGYIPQRPLLEENQQNRFHRFLLEFQLYRKTVLDRSRRGKPRKLLLIEDIPQVFYMHPEKLHAELLAVYEHFGPRTVPIVFIFSDSTNTNISGGLSSNAEYRLLPKWLQEKLHLQEITFKPVTEAAMKRALTRVNKTLLEGMLTVEAIGEVVAASSGDIRNALNYLVFRHSLQIATSSPPSSSSSKSNKKAKVTGKKGSSKAYAKTNGHNGTSTLGSVSDTPGVIASGREDQLTLTHAVGKIMYAKRSAEADPAAVEYLTSAKRSPHFDRAMLRNILQEQRPEEIAERTNASADTLLEWSYENYPDFLSTSSDAMALAQALDCLEVLSTADATLREAGFESQPTMEAVRTSYVIRGQMFSLNRDASAYQAMLAELDVQKRNSSKIPDQTSQNFKRNTFTFHQLRGPKFWQLHRASVGNLSQLVTLKESGLYRGAAFEPDKNMVMDILPAVGSISSIQGRLATMDNGLRGFAAEMACFSGCDFNRMRRKLPEDGWGGFTELSNTQQYNRSNLPPPSSSGKGQHLQLQSRSPFLKLEDSSSDDEDEQKLVVEADSDEEERS